MNSKKMMRCRRRKGAREGERIRLNEGGRGKAGKVCTEGRQRKRKIKKGRRTGAGGRRRGDGGKSKKREGLMTGGSKGCGEVRITRQFLEKTNDRGITSLTLGTA